MGEEVGAKPELGDQLAGRGVAALQPIDDRRPHRLTQCGMHPRPGSQSPLVVH